MLKLVEIIENITVPWNYVNKDLNLSDDNEEAQWLKNAKLRWQEEIQCETSTVHMQPRQDQKNKNGNVFPSVESKLQIMFELTR